MRRGRPLAAALAAFVLLAAGCGGDGDEDEEAAGGGAPAQTETDRGAGDGSTRDLERKPDVPRPSGEPPEELEVEDIVEGRGRAARAGDTVSVHYVGVSFSDGRQFDASWDRGQPFRFELGAGEVIPGWDRGIAGMKRGGRRRLVIPPDLAYGAEGSPPAIGPNETLVFVVDLLELR